MPVLIFDAHLDLAMNGVDWNRDMRMAVADIRVQEKLLGLTDPGRQTNTTSFPELKRAEVKIGVATLIARLEQQINHPLGMTSPEACYAMAHAHLAYYRAMEKSGYVKMLRTRESFRTHADAALSGADVPFGFVLSMECADAVLDPDNIREWFDNGLRAIGITHYGANRYGGGTRCEVGLAVDALPLLKNIEELGIILDMTHLSDNAFWQVADRFGGKILASHQNARKFCNWQRQFSDEQLKSVFERGGVVGISFDAIMLQEGWVRCVTKPVVTIERAIDNIDHMCQLAGNAKQIGIGSDLDGGFGYDQTPADLNTIADLQKIPAMLEKRGYAAADIAGIMHGNWIRYFAESLPA